MHALGLLKWPEAWACSLDPVCLELLSRAWHRSCLKKLSDRKACSSQSCVGTRKAVLGEDGILTISPAQAPALGPMLNWGHPGGGRLA